MRIFAAIRPTDAFRAALSVLQDNLRAAGVTGRYLDPSNLHMTLAFVGEWPENISDLLPAVTEPFSVRLSRPGVFPAAKVLWAGAEPCPALDRLAAQVQESFRENSIPFDPKPFNPHITLIRKPVLPAGLDLSEIPVPSAAMEVTEVCLYRSDRGEDGMAYTVVGSSGDRGVTA